MILFFDRNEEVMPSLLDILPHMGKQNTRPESKIGILRSQIVPYDAPQCLNPGFRFRDLNRQEQSLVRPHGLSEDMHSIKDDRIRLETQPLP